MKKVFLAAVLAAFAFSISLPAPAADKPSDKAAEKEAKGKFRPFNGKIKEVDKTAKTIKLEGEKAQTFMITSDTKIQKDGKSATLDDVTVGETVGGRARENADGKWEATSLRLGQKPAKEPKDEEKK